MNLFLPDWLDTAAWSGFCKMREQMDKKSKGKVPWSEYAEQLALNRLGDFHAEGYDVNWMLNEAVLHGWRWVFANERTPRIGGQNSTRKPAAEGAGVTKRVESFDERRRREAQATLSEINARANAVVRKVERQLPGSHHKQAPDGDVC